MSANYQLAIVHRDKVCFSSWDIRIIITYDTSFGVFDILFSQDTSHASIYLSYEWDKQSVVKQLRRGLMSLGYNCWMDVFALSGSEPLVEQAERALHQADIVISCVTTRYSHAEQCRRDVALASTLNKPMVVLVLESTDWPPAAGPMQEALNNQTYINCVDAGLQRPASVIRPLGARYHATVDAPGDRFGVPVDLCR